MADAEQRLASLLHEVADRVGHLVAAEERVRALLDAVVAVASDIDLTGVLRRITESAADLAQARYAALGVISPDGRLSEFITHGITTEQRLALGAPPEGHGLLGLLITDPRPLRLDDLTAHPRSVGFPAGHPPMTTLIGVPIQVRDAVFGNLYLCEKDDGSRFSAEDEAAVVALAAAAGVAIDNARLFEQAHQRTRQVAAVAQVQQAVLTGPGPDGALTLVAEHATDLTASLGSAVVLAQDSAVVLAQDDDRLHVRAAAGVLGVLSGEVIAPGAALSGAVAGDGAVVLDGADVPELAGTGTVVVVPVTGPHHSAGALLVGRAAPPFGEHEMDVLRGLAGQAGMALDRAQAQEDRAALAVLSDRERIARDLHDVVIQRLFATGLSLQGSLPVLDRPGAAERISGAVDALDATIADVRRTIFELQRGPNHSGLRSAVTQVVEDARDGLGFRPRVRFHGALDTAAPESLTTQLGAVLTEALSNAARHARASRVDIEVAADGGLLRLDVRDDGVGFTDGVAESGLHNMRERAARHGGTCRVETSPGVGTRVSWQVPLDG